MTARIKTVVETYVRETMKLIHIRVSGEEIVTTEGHPFYVKDIGFVNACDLIVGEELVDISGKVLLVEDIRVEYTPEPVKVYNFQVEDYHTYYVGSLEIWVHNATYNDEGLIVDGEDIKAIRKKYSLNDTNTIAVGKTNVPGLEDIMFEGGSPKVRKQLGIQDLDVEMPNRSIKAPSDNPLFTRHAEEVIVNKFDNAVHERGIPIENIVGVLRIHQSNPSGVCRKCIQGLMNDNVKPGVLKQLSLKYPELTIKITSEIDSNINVTGRLEIIVKNGKYI